MLKSSKSYIMPFINNKISAAKIIYLIVFSSIFLWGCNKQESVVRVDLPATPILTIQAQWGVVNAPYLRVRKEPNIAGGVVDHLRIGSLAEILSKTEQIETIEDKKDYWYEIYSNGVRGWVFGAYLDFFDSVEKARSSARQYK